MKLPKLLLTLGAIAGLSAAANADLLYTFDSDIGPDFTQTVIWSSHLGGTAQSTSPGGWALGGNSPKKEFSWQAGGGAANQQAAMTAYANAGNYRVAWDILIDGTSFPVAGSDWYNLLAAGNSDGSAAWTQVTIASGLWHNDGDPALLSQHADKSFAELGWQPGDTWFQIFFGVQSGAIPINYYIDNLSIYQVPEPTTAVLLGIGALLLTLRRRPA